MANSVEITEVFCHNFKEEEHRLLPARSRYKAIAFDTEFPGLLHQIPRDASDERSYRDLKYNVERIRIIQVGFTVFDPITGSIGGVWQINMAGFNPKVHPHSPDSITFLEAHGIDLARNLAIGVRMTQFIGLLKNIREIYGVTIEWVTFHGTYDAAYLVVSLLWTLPPEIGGFTPRNCVYLI